MIIIPQNFKNEAEKILKDEFILTIKQNFDLFNDFFYSSFYQIMLLGKIKKIILETYVHAITKIDQLFMNSPFRKNRFYKSTSKNRTIVTIFGELNFERYYYVNKDKKNGFFFIDYLFNFEKYTTYDPIVRGILIDYSVTNNCNSTSINYDLILLNLTEYLLDNQIIKIPRQTIYNWIHKWDIPKVEYKCYEGCKNLYVMIDEKWIHEQIRLDTLTDEEKAKRHFVMSKCFVTFTGAKTKNDRKELLNRHVFMTTSDKPWKNFMDEIYNIYNFEEIENIYMLSDSGNWIISGKDNLKLFKNNNVILNTCEFHVKQYINRMTHSKEKRENIIKAIYEDKNKDDFIKLADEIIDNAKNKDKKKQYKNYILNHWQTILNMKEREIRSSMESHISHYVAAHFGSRPKGYSRKRLESYIKLEENKINGINILDLYLKSYDKTAKDNYIYNKKEVSFQSFENNTSILPTKTTLNPISIVLTSIAYNY